MIDFHSHFLPKMDDGSRSSKESIQMLRSSYQSGVRYMVATPHFYASQESPEQFLQRREASWQHLKAQLPGKVPGILLGAEVYYFNGIFQNEEIRQLCIQETRVLLLEMPFQRWSESMIEEIIALREVQELIVVLAHIDRYLKWQPPEVWERLMKRGIRFQVNADAFLQGFLKSHRIFQMLHQGQVHVLGSDCHNMSSRKPNLKEAIQKIQEKAGSEPCRRIEAFTRKLCRLSLEESHK